MGKPDYFPGAMYFCIGGYFQGYRSLRLSDLNLIVSPASIRDVPSPPERVTRPDERLWRNFWRSVNRLDVWSWQRNYTTPGVMDGTDWSMLLRYQGRSVRSSGSNGYPKKGEISDEFERSDLEKLAKALNRLTGDSEMFW